MVRRGRDCYRELRRIPIPRLSEKGKRSLPCSLTEHQNGTFRPIFASQHVQIRAQSVVRTPFHTVSELDFSHCAAYQSASIKCFIRPLDFLRVRGRGQRAKSLCVSLRLLPAHEEQAQD